MNRVMRKLYLKQAYDTAQLFNATRQLFVIAQGLDSVEMIPNKKGKCEYDFRKSHSEYLNRIRPNLYNGGTWFIRKQKYKEAYQFFDQYIACSTAPMFQSYKYAQKTNIFLRLLIGLFMPDIRCKIPKLRFIILMRR